MSFYRIYRPQVFEELDNVKVRETLLSLLSKDKKNLPHAYLFSGPRGTGKTTAARLVAKLFNCEKPTKTGEPCGMCEQCKAIASGRAMDVLEIDAASNTGVENIRDLREKIALAPSAAKWKIYIIDEVHMLSTGAFNALLKTLEEPPEHAIFILATTDVQKVPITIQSRCMHIAFTRPDTKEIIAALKRIVEKEAMDIDDESLRLLAASAEGSFRDAVKLLEQVSFHKGKVTVAVVAELLSLSDEKHVREFLDHLVHKESKSALSDIASLVKEGKDIKTFLIGTLSELEKLLIASIQEKSIAPWDRELLSEIIRRFSSAYTEMRSTSIAQLPLELAVVEFCSQDHREPVILRSPEVTEGSLAHASLNPPVGGLKDSSPPAQNDNIDPPSLGMLTLEKLADCWKDFIEAAKPYNHSVAAVLRSSRPTSVERGIVTIEAFYKFHQEKLLEPKTRDILSQVLKKLFGEKVKVEIVLGKKSN